MVCSAGEAGLRIGTRGALLGALVAEVIGNVGVVGVWTNIDADLGHWVPIKINIADDGALVDAIVGVIKAPCVVSQDRLTTVRTASHTLLVFFRRIGTLGADSHTRIINCLTK